MEKTIQNSTVVKRALPVMDDAIYFSERLQSQIDYHDRKARENQKKYKLFKRIEFILAASIPVLISISAMGVFENINLFPIYKIIEGKNTIVSYVNITIILQLIAALAGVFLAFINKMLELDEYYKNWKEFRYTHERLLQEKILYQTQSDPYDEENAYSIFVVNIENILSTQVKNWKQLNKAPSNDMVKKALDLIENNKKDGTNNAFDTSTVSEITVENEMTENHKINYSTEITVNTSKNADDTDAEG